eukprot:SAG31_NODE_1256_length_9081_cov_13.160655_7_plen_74_part_00
MNIVIYIYIFKYLKNKLVPPRRRLKARPRAAGIMAGMPRPAWALARYDLVRHVGRATIPVGPGQPPEGFDFLR